MIQKEQVEHIAELARLKLSEAEISAMQKDLAEIFDYINLLEEVDISKVEPTFYPLPLENVYREDKAEGSEPNTAKAMLEQVPQKQGDYVKVKEILT